MPDKKLTEPVDNPKRLTDNEIIKALKCCGRERCFGCPYRGKCHQGNPMIKDALDLITRQQAEIDSLRADLKRACAEIDNAQICKYSFIASSSILDFAERLRRNAVGLKLANRDYRFVSVKEIDSLVIKMSGETHEW